MIFEFTNEKPSSEKIWEKINNSRIPDSTVPVNLIKTMMWILVSAGNDFKRSKESINKVLDSKTPMNAFRRSFHNGLKNSKSSPPLHVNPTNYDAPADLSVVYTDGNPSLELPIAIFKDIFKQSPTSNVVALAHRVFPSVSPAMEKALKDDQEMAKGNFDILTEYGLAMMPDETLFSHSVLRQLFHPADSDTDICEITSKDELKLDMRKRLTDAVKSDPTTTSITLPTYKLPEGDNSEA